MQLRPPGRLQGQDVRSAPLVSHRPPLCSFPLPWLHTSVSHATESYGRRRQGPSCGGRVCVCVCACFRVFVCVSASRVFVCVFVLSSLPGRGQDTPVSFVYYLSAPAFVDLFCNSDRVCPCVVYVSSWCGRVSLCVCVSVCCECVSAVSVCAAKARLAQQARQPEAART